MRRAVELSPADWPRVLYGVRWDGRGRGLVFALAGLIAALLCTLLLASSAVASARMVPVVVTGKGSAAAVKAAGGKVTHRVRLIDGVIARVPRRSLRAVRRAHRVRSVIVDRAFRTRSDDGEDDAPAMLGESAPATDDVPADATTLSEVRRSIGADRLDASGDGVDVALIDSGITPVGDLADPGKVVNGPDFSFDRRNDDLRHLDAFGHGTHLAGIIAGVAPQARLVNIKAANAEGVTSLTQLLLAIDYAVRYRHANGLDIRVITLAVGADDPDGYEHDPLAVAVERAWNAGVAVVTSGGNEGNSGDGLLLPAADPFVLAVGGADTQGTGNPADDDVADWSSRGDGDRNPDVLAPGSSIVSYRVPGLVHRPVLDRPGRRRPPARQRHLAGRRRRRRRRRAAVRAPRRLVARPAQGRDAPGRPRDGRRPARGRRGRARRRRGRQPSGPPTSPRASSRRGCSSSYARRPPLLRRRAPPPRPPRPPLDRAPLDGRAVERRKWNGVKW